MLPESFNTLFPVPAARLRFLRLLCFVVCCCLLFAPRMGRADNPPGAPPNTRIMLINPSNVPEDVTTRFQGGNVTGFYNNPPIPLSFNYSSEQVFNSKTGQPIGYMVYPAQLTK